MIHFNQEKLDSLHNIFKINLINSCSGYKPANLIATVSKKGVENVAITGTPFYRILISQAD